MASKKLLDTNDSKKFKDFRDKTNILPAFVLPSENIFLILWRDVGPESSADALSLLF